MKFSLGAGPVSVHERVSLALARAPLDHEDPDFQELFRATTEKLRRRCGARATCASSLWCTRKRRAAP
jgi:aspartate aminotransferase-like enzyme